MLVRTSAVLGGVALALLITTGCDGGSKEDGTFQLGTVSAQLGRAQSCDDLLSRLKADAVAKVRMNAELAGDERAWMAWGGDMVSVQNDGAGPPGGVRSDTGVDLSGSPEVASTSPESYSETNTQVAGVDEADIVKTDGDHIYLLHGNELIVLDSWPADATTISAQIEVEGTPIEMFVANGRALVYSRTADPEPGDAQLYAPDCRGCEWSYCGAYYGESFLKLTVIDVSQTTPSVLHESYAEGYYVSARMHGTLTRGVVQGGFKGPNLYPYVEYWDASGNQRSEDQILADIALWRRDAEAAIEATELEDWLPRSYAKQDGTLRAVAPECTSYYVPEASASAFGVTQIAALDLADEKPEVTSISISGEAHEIYANQDVLLLAHSDYSWDFRGMGGDQTAMHLFDIQDDKLNYVGSGFAPGTVHDQFSLDQRDDIVRLSTTQQAEANGQWETTNWVVTLKPNAKGELVMLGKSEALAPGETIYSTRFVGDIAYVVTFRQMDPLFAVDLKDPTHPTLLGELEIPGFSDYMHPMGDDHLLTIGRDIDPVTQTDRGLLLQIFDVSEPANPVQAFSFSYNRQGWSEANSEHKAFNYYAPLDLLAFPYTDYSVDATSSLELFRVTTDKGFEQLGSIDHSGFANASCYDEVEGYWKCNYSPDVRRGLFIDQFVYSISYGGVLVNSIENLQTPVASVDLPEPVISDYYYY